MQMPGRQPTRPPVGDHPSYASAGHGTGLTPQADAFQCSLCCAGKAGFAACVALCIATGMACDGGIPGRNCSSCG